MEMIRGWVRQRVRSLFRDDPDITLIDGYLSDKEYRALLSKSKFCLCLRGNRASCLCSFDVSRLSLSRLLL